MANAILGTCRPTCIFVHTVSHEIQQMRLKQSNSWTTLQIIDRRHIYQSQQFEEIMKIKTFVFVFVY